MPARFMFLDYSPVHDRQGFYVRCPAGGLKRSHVASQQTAEDCTEAAAVEVTAVKVQRKRRGDGSERVTATAAAVGRRSRK